MVLLIVTGLWNQIAQCTEQSQADQELQPRSGPVARAHNAVCNRLDWFFIGWKDMCFRLCLTRYLCKARTYRSCLNIDDLAMTVTRS